MGNIRKLTKAECRALSKLNESGGTASCSEINESIVTMQNLKRIGLVCQVERFGDEVVLGKEREKINWSVNKNVLNEGYYD